MKPQDIRRMKGERRRRKIYTLYREHEKGGYDFWEVIKIPAHSLREACIIAAQTLKCSEYDIDCIE